MYFKAYNVVVESLWLNNVKINLQYSIDTSEELKHVTESSVQDNTVPFDEWKFHESQYKCMH